MLESELVSKCSTPCDCHHTVLHLEQVSTELREFEAWSGKNRAKSESLAITCSESSCRRFEFLRPRLILLLLVRFLNRRLFRSSATSRSAGKYKRNLGRSSGLAGWHRVWVVWRFIATFDRRSFYNPQIVTVKKLDQMVFTVFTRKFYEVKWSIVMFPCHHLSL